MTTNTLMNAGTAPAGERNELISKAIQYAYRVRYADRLNQNNKQGEDTEVVKIPRRGVQTDLAKESGMTQNAIHKYSKKWHVPKLSSAKKLQKGTGNRIFWFEFILGREVTIEELEDVILHKMAMQDEINQKATQTNGS